MESEDQQLPAKIDPGGVPDTQTTKTVGNVFTRGPWGSAVQFIIMWGRILVPERIRHSWLAWLALALFIFLIIIWKIREERDRLAAAWFTDTFSFISDDSLEARGWNLQSPNAYWWLKRGERKGEGGLTFYTLQAEESPADAHTGRISNLLIRSVPVDCFATEVRFADFMPREEGQQAGILLLEDSSLASPYIGFSITCRNAPPGSEEAGDILLEAFTSDSVFSRTSFSPAKAVLFTKNLFRLQEEREGLIQDSLRWSALRIEKRKDSLRFLYDAGPADQMACKTVFTKAWSLTPHYIALFAMKGSTEAVSEIPATVRYFSTQPLDCKP